MAGYVAVFDSVFNGTLHGRWPALPVWLTLLPLADKDGCIDMSYRAICGATGWPEDLLRQGIGELMQPDDESRSDASDGRRLTLLDPSRSWGWRIVNHGLYRERARLKAKSEREIREGINRERMSDRRGPPKTAADPLSNANANANAYPSEDKSSSGGEPPKRARQVPEDFAVPSEVRDKLTAELPADFDVELETAKFRDYEFREPHRDWLRAWRGWMRRARDRGDYARRRMVSGWE